MTSVERHRSTHHLLFVGRTDSLPYNNTHHYESTSPRVRATKKRRIPPAVPSPPHPSSKSDESASSQKTHRLRTHSMDEMEEQENDQWFFTEAELASTPSIIDGVLPVDERCRRAKGVNFIIQAGIMLKLPQLTLATASVFFHRYFMRVSMVPEKGGQHHYNIAATALFLATKTEENCRQTNEIVIAVAKVAQKNPKLLIDKGSKEYWKWRDNLLTFEEHMLEMLTFDVVVEPPYTCLWRFLHQLQLEENKAIRNAAWAFINDSCLTPLCLLIRPQDIAISAIYFASKSTKEQIEDDENGRSWWVQLDGQIENIAKGLNVMNDFWTENPLNRSDNPWTMSPLNDENDRDKTRKSTSRRELSPSPNERGTRRGSHTSQNGYNHSQEHSRSNNNTTTSKSNGITTNGTTTHPREPTSPIKPQDIPAPTTESDNPPPPPAPASASTSTSQPIPKIELEEPEAEPEPVSGSSDTALKEAANDPSTHEHTTSENGVGLERDLAARPVAASGVSGGVSISPKRKRDDDGINGDGEGEKSAKRVKAEVEEEEGELVD